MLGGAPRPARATLLRARLVLDISERWRLPAVTLVAGAGFGKTTLLAHAIADNLDDPKGHDVWVPLRREHGSASVLVDELSRRLSISSEARHASALDVEPVTAAISSFTPTHVCLLFDDVHLLEPGSSGAAWLDALISSLPSNGHVVLSGRPVVPVAMARRLALGQAVAITEEDLRFDDDETEAFAALRATSPDLLAGCGGWPAHAELVATVNRAAASDFVLEEVVATLSPERRRQLAALALVGAANDEMLSAACGEQCSAFDVVRHVPLSWSTADGSAQLHDLWRPAMETQLAPEERRVILCRAAAHAQRSRDAARAARLLIEAGALRELLDLAREVCFDSHPLVPVEVLYEWYDALVAGGLGESAEALLLAGTARKPTDPLASVPWFERACTAFEGSGDNDGQAACLFHLGHVFWWHERADALVGLFDRLTTLSAGGSKLAAGLIQIGLLVFDELAGDDSAVAAATARPDAFEHPEIAPITYWLGARCTLQLGSIDRALAMATLAAHDSTPTMQPVADLLVLACRWAAGEREHVVREVDGAIDALERLGWLHNRAADGAQAAMWLALSGQVGRAREHLERAARVAEQTGPWARALLGIAASVLAVCEGDEARAAASMRRELAERPIDDPAIRRAHRPWLAVSYVLVPETRGTWDAAELSGRNALARRIASALVAARSGQTPSSADCDGFDVPPVVRSLVAPQWAGELSAVLHAAGREGDAAGLVTDLADFHSGLVAARTSPAAAVAASAERLLATVARRPARSIGIGVLGELQFALDGEPAWPDQLNRRSVRELLGLLVEYRMATRQRACALLWPGLDDTAARNNLRVTLSHLNRALEPARATRSAPYFVREHGDQLELVDDRFVAIDVNRFRDAVTRASRLGNGPAALSDLVAAADLYRGEYLADLRAAEWVEAPRRELHLAFVRTAVRAAELLTAQTSYDDAERLVHRALAAEPWSEAAYRVLAEVQVGRGDSAGARRVLRDCDTMLSNLGVRREPATDMLARRLSL